MEQVKKISEKSILGKHIKCRRCEEEAYIYLEDGRYRTKCYTCQEDTYLKIYNQI
jgi:ribosomal protein L37E